MIPIYDTGHGYNTPGKRSIGLYTWNRGKKVVKLKENSVNEAVGNKLSLLYYLNGEESHFITNEWYDVSLSERVTREKQIEREVRNRGKESVFISIHADAFTSPGPTGGRFFYYSEGGRKIAEKLTKFFRDNGYPLSLREPMKANFKMIRETASYAVLFEMGFMTTPSDLEKLLDDDFRNKTATLLYKGIKSL